VKKFENFVGFLIFLNLAARKEEEERKKKEAMQALSQSFGGYKAQAKQVKTRLNPAG
jgi:hypothetical protein